MRTLRCPALCALVVAVATVSCGEKGAHQVTATGAPQGNRSGENREQRLDHIMPARDFVGRAPKTFSWTVVQGADSYSIGVWNEVDVMVWRQNNIPAASVNTPDDVEFQPGTYFWSVSALRNGEEIADSGLSAFVVRTAP
jgi:hypothetical protein